MFIALKTKLITPNKFTHKKWRSIYVTIELVLLCCSMGILSQWPVPNCCLRSPASVSILIMKLPAED